MEHQRLSPRHDGGRTPNIDRVAEEGELFTDYCAQQSCTAGRAAFITGQHPFRTGLLTIGMPGAKQGLQDKDPTLAELLKPHGYTSGQSGKNHLGDLGQFLPTAHGFDEFYGNLYHLNAEEEPETYHYPKDKEIFCFDAGGNLNAIRYDQWKIHFTIMEVSINEAYRKTPSWPLVISLRQDPFEVSPDAAPYTRWYGDRMWMFVPAQAYVQEFLSTLKEFLPSRAVGSLSVEKVLQQMQSSAARQ